MPRPKFHLRSLFILTAVVAAIAWTVAFVWEFEAAMGRIYDEYRQAATEAKSHGNELSFGQWSHNKDLGRLARENDATNRASPPTDLAAGQQRT